MSDAEEEPEDLDLDLSLERLQEMEVANDNSFHTEVRRNCYLHRSGFTNLTK